MVKVKVFSDYDTTFGYPVMVVGDGEVYCADCANKRVNEPGYEDGDLIAGINYENSYLYCDDCGTHIESAYGEDTEEED